MSEAPEVSGEPVVTPVRVIIGLCLFAPFVAMLWVGSYAKADPEFIGIPFFYWYQMAWVLLSTALTMVAYQLWQRDQRARARARTTAASTSAPTSNSDSASKGGGE